MSNVKQKKLTIGIVLPYLNSRGPDRQALGLTRAFIEKGADVVVFVAQGWGREEMYQAFRESGAAVVNMGGPAKKGVKKVHFSVCFRLAALAVKHRCDVLLSRAGRTNQICGMAGLMTFIPSIEVLVIAPSDMATPAHLSSSILKRYAPGLHLFRNFGLPRFVVSVSGEILKNFLEIYPFMKNRVKVIPNGVNIPDDENDADGPVTLDEGKFNIGYSGSLIIKRKGMDVLLDALKRLVTDFGLARARLILIGTGEDESRLKEMVQTNSLTDYVVFAGERFNPSSIIKQCDAFVLPSRYEGFPNTLLEAMSLGICCIAADCKTGPKEIIENGKNGMLVPVGDSKAMAEAIALLEKDSNLRSELAANGFRIIKEKYSCRKMTDGYFEIIMKVI